MVLDRLFYFVASLRLTVVCLGLSIILVFVGTLAQVDMGIYAAQAKYFRSLLIYWKPPGLGFSIPVMPGGYLLGSVLLANLILAYIKGFELTKERAGLLLVHLGLILLLLGQLATDMLQTESSMRLTEGQAKNYSEDHRRSELAVMETTNPAHNEVVAFSESALARQGELRHPSLPFTIRVKQYLVNSDPKFHPPVTGGEARGVASMVEFAGLPRTTRMDARDIPAAQVEIVGDKGSLGVWWVSNWVGEDGPLGTLLQQTGPAVQATLKAPQAFSVQQKTYQLVMRPARYYKPFSLELQKFAHDKYMGTDIPKNFSSRVRIQRGDTKEDREVLIYMNNPLRYEGETFYQAGYDEHDARVTILQVVRNPGWLTPYLSCSMVGLGLVIQFMSHLVGFVRKKAA